MMDRKHVLRLPAIIATTFLIGYFLELIQVEELHSNSFEIISELFTVFVSFSIFAMTWFAYHRSRDNHALFLGATFLVIGLLDIFHTLSYPFMPAFITPNSQEKSAFFWIAARLISAPLFLTSVYIYKDTLHRQVSKPFLLLFAVLLSFIFLVLGLFYLGNLPSFYSQGRNFSIARIFELIITLVLVLYAGYFYTERIRQTGENNLIFLVYGFVIAAFSDVVYFIYELSGHLLKTTAFYFIFLALYRSSVELPYEKLAQAEEKLRIAAEEKYRNLFDNANDAIITLDLEGKVTSWNKAAEKLFGWTAQEITGKKFPLLAVPENLRTERDQIVRSVLAGMAFTGFETVRQRKDGTKINVSLTISPLLDVDKKITGLSSIIRDITERRKFEEKLRASEAKFRNLVEQSLVGVYIIQDGKFKYVNPKLAEIFGYTQEEIVPSRRVLDLVAEKDRTLVAENLHKRLKGDIPSIDYTFRGLRKDGRQIEIEVIGTRTEFNGKPAVIGTLLDITEHRRAEEIRMENERLAASSKAKSEFLATMSHELRTPLNAIIGFSELLKEKEGGELNEKQRRYVENITASSKHLLALINDILDVSKVEAGKIELAVETISVPETINETLTLVKERAARRNVMVKKELDPALEFIEADKLRLKQVLFNLLDNAVKFSKPDGGTVVVKAKKEGDMLKISVSDTGIGIKEEDMGKLFKEFEQASSGIARKYGGTGLGLAISKKLVEMHGGRIWAESKFGEGSTFTFLLPTATKKGYTG